MGSNHRLTPDKKFILGTNCGLFEGMDLFVKEVEIAGKPALPQNVVRDPLGLEFSC